LRKGPGLTDLIEVDLVETCSRYAIEDQDFVRVARVCAENSDIKVPIGPKHQAFGPVKMLGTTRRNGRQVTGENIDKAPGIRVKAQNVTREHVSCTEVTHDRDIKSIIGAEDYAAGIKPSGEAGNIEGAEELSRLSVEPWDPSRMSTKITEVGYVQRRVDSADEAARCKRAIWIAVPAKGRIAGDKRAETAAAELQNLAGKGKTNVLISDVQLVPEKDEPPGSLQTAAARRDKGAQISAGLRIEVFDRIIPTIADIEGIG